MKQPSLIRAIATGFILGIIAYGTLAPQIIIADSEDIIPSDIAYVAGKHDTTSCSTDRLAGEIAKNITMMVTAYASVPEETDSTPFITASGSHVADGVVATNILPMGTKVRIPKLFGNKIFTVEDRMNQKYNGKYQLDIWMPSVQNAKDFGARLADIQVVKI